MNRKMLIAAALFASSAYIACGGGSEEMKPANPPPPVETVTTPPPPPAPAPEPTPSVTASAEPPPAPKSLFERVGGKDGVAKVAEPLAKGLTTNAKTKNYFAKFKDPKKADVLKAGLADFICKESGGPCEFDDKDVKAQFKKVKEAEVAAFFDELQKALDAAGVAKPEQEELTAKMKEYQTANIPAEPAKAAAAGGKTAPAPKASAK